MIAISILWLFVLAVLVAVSAVISYLRLLMRRLTAVSALKIFPSGADGRLRADRERVGVSLSALHGAAMGLFSMGLMGWLVLVRPHALWQNLAVATVVVLGVVVIFDQFVPFKLVARHDEPEPILARMTPLLHASVYAALPFSFPMLISNTIRRVLEPPSEPGEAPNPQEGLQELIEAGEQEGLIKESEGELLQSVVEFKDKVVREVMAPRPEIAAVEINSSIEQLRQVFRERRYTRYPVYTAQLDNIEGIVSVRDLMGLPPEEQSKMTLRSLVQPVRFVPETKHIHALLKELQQTTTQLAIVIDEYGRVAGLVTLEDLVEEIVGDIRDEVDPHLKDIVEESPNTYLVAGDAELAQIGDRLDRTFEPGDYSTVAGLLITKLGHMPVRGEILRLDALTFEVLDANRRRVLKVRLTLAPPAPAANSAHAESPAI